MNVNHRRAQKPEPINYNLRILELDHSRVIQQLNELHTVINTNYSKDDINAMDAYLTDYATVPNPPVEPPTCLQNLRERFEYISMNLPTCFNMVVRCPSINMTILRDMIDGAFKIGQRQVDPSTVQVDIAQKINDECITKKIGN